MGLPKVKKPTELRESIFEALEQNAKGESFLIPHKSGASLLLNEAEHRSLLEKLDNLKAINQGLQDYLDGKTYSHAQVIKFIAKKKSQWTKKK